MQQWALSFKQCWKTFTIRSCTGTPKNLRETLLSLVDEKWAKEQRKRFIDWDNAGMTRDEMLDTCREGVIGFLKTMKAQKLLGPYARSEVHLVGWVDRWLCLGGYSDFIIRREDSGITLLDGKNSQQKELRPGPTTMVRSAVSPGIQNPA